MNDETSPAGASLDREKRLLRRAGWIVLFVGSLLSAVVFLIAAHARDARLAEYEQAQERAETRQLEHLYGKSGAFVEDLSAALKRPDVLGGSIAAASAFIALGCFYLGRRANPPGQ